MPDLKSLVDDAMHYRNVGGSGCFRHSQDATDLLTHGTAALGEIEQYTVVNVGAEADVESLRGFHSVMVIYNQIIDQNELYDRAVGFANRITPDCLLYFLSGMYIVYGCAKPKRQLPDSYCTFLGNLKPEQSQRISDAIDQILSNTKS